MGERRAEVVELCSSIARHDARATVRCGEDRPWRPVAGSRWPEGVVTFVCVHLVIPPRPFAAPGASTLRELDVDKAGARHVLSSWGGVIVEGEHAEGAEVLAAFDDPETALEAAAMTLAEAATRAWMGSGDAGSAARTEIGIAVHAGVASPGDGRYEGIATYQARRLAATANTGQIVVSGTVAGLVTGTAAVELRPVGRYLVPDFTLPVELHVASHPAVPSCRTPLRARRAHHHGTSHPRTCLIGRGAELDELAARTATTRLVTVTGTGGVGKTRLVAEHRRRHADRWFDGMWWVALAEVTDGSLAVRALADAVGAHSGPTGEATSADEVLDAVVEHLADVEAALVLDNCEHLRTDVALLADRLLRDCPSLHLIATSREPLGLRDECVLHLGPLEQVDAVALFRARRGGRLHPPRPADAGADLDTAAIGRVCRHLDGLPLAIELAAAQAGALGPEEMVGLLERRWFPRGDDPTLERRQRTPADLVDWSWALLSEAERAGLGRLTVFDGEFSLDAACAALTGAAPGSGDRAGAADVVCSLARRCLLEVSSTGGSTRYRMLSTTRAVVQGGVAPAEHVAAATAAARHLLATLGPEVRPIDRALLDRRAQELPNLCHLARLLAGHAPDVADDLVWTVAHLERLDGSAIAAAALHEHLTRCAHAGPQRIALLVEAGRGAAARGELDIAEGYLDEARRLADSHPILPGFDMQLELLAGSLYVLRGAPNLARSSAATWLPQARSAAGRARMLQLAGTAARAVGEHDDARRHLSAARDLCVELGDLVGAEALDRELARDDRW